MDKKQESKKIDFNEFVDEATRYAHSELLLHGAKGLKNAIFMYISSALIHRDDGKL